MSAPTPEDIGIAGVVLTYLGGPDPDCRVHPARLPDDPCAECEVLAGARVIAKVRAQVRRQALLDAADALSLGEGPDVCAGADESVADWLRERAEREGGAMIDPSATHPPSAGEEGVTA